MIVADWRSSGLCVAAFCRSRHVNKSGFHRWRHILTQLISSNGAGQFFRACHGAATRVASTDVSHSNSAGGNRIVNDRRSHLSGAWVVEE